MVRDKMREMELRHAAGVDDREVSPGEERGVRDDEISDEHDKENRE